MGEFVSYGDGDGGRGASLCHARARLSAEGELSVRKQGTDRQTMQMGGWVCVERGGRERGLFGWRKDADNVAQAGRSMEEKMEMEDGESLAKRKLEQK